MDSSNNTNYQEPLSSFLHLPQPPPPPPTSSSSSPSPSFFDPLPSYLPTFHSSPLEPSSSSPQPQPPPRSSKKRSRASRRAPTTVLTTDTSNFRAMVQEFTGFPAPPFAASSPSPFPRPPLHHLPPSSSSSFPYFLSPQKLPTPSSLVDAIANRTTTTTTSENINSNYPFLHPNMIGIQNPILAPHFGDLGSLMASEGVQQAGSRDGGLHSWAEDEESQPDKRQKTDGVVESWIHSSD